MFDYSVNTFGTEHARTARKLLQILAVFSDTGHSGFRYLSATAELEAREVLAPERDQDQSVVVYARGSSVATKSEFRDRVEPGKLF